MTIEDRVRRAMEARADLVQARAAPALRVEEGHLDGPSGPKRLVAGTVAFVIFAVAAVFGWQAFRPGDRDPLGPSAASATIELASTDDAPTATLTFDGAEQSGVFEGYSWCSTPDDCNTLTFDLSYPALEEAVEVPVGTPIRFEGTGRVERLVIRTTEGNRASANVVADSDGTAASVPDEPGDYMIWVAADWEQGSGAFYLRVRATSPSDDVVPPDSNAPVRFLPADGWVNEADASGGDDPASAWTSNVEMTAGGTFPALMELPDDGVLLTVAQIGDEPPTADNQNFPPAELPLTLPEELETAWEGFIEGTSRHKLWVAVEGRALDIAVYYGTIEPSEGQLIDAQAALGRLSVAPGQTPPTYLIDRIEIQYPYKSDEDRAGITYRTRWGTDRYPGEGQCIIVLEDDAGVEVGRRDFSLLSAQRSSTIEDAEIVPVDGTPAKAWGRCGDPIVTNDLDGQGYVFSDWRVAATDLAHGTVIWVTVRWEEDKPPGARRCVYTVEHADGSSETLEGTLHIGQPSDELSLLPKAAPDEVAAVSADCRPPS